MVDLNVVNFITIGLMSAVSTALLMILAKWFGLDVSAFGF